MVKRVPDPSRDSTSTPPPIERISSRASKAPMPNPPFFEDTNGLNRLLRMNCGDMPWPLSITVTLPDMPSLYTSTITELLVSLASIAFCTRWTSAWSKASGLPSTATGSDRRTATG